MDPLTQLLFAAGGLWLLGLTIMAIFLHTRQRGLETLVADLKTDLKLEAVRTRQDLVETVRGEIGYALAGRPGSTTFAGTNTITGPVAGGDVGRVQTGNMEA